jgi:phosphatidylglycerophosphate synthase
MATSTEKAPAAPIALAEKERAARELVVAYGFAPAARPLVRVLLALRVPPPAVVVAHLAVGLAAAAALALGGLVLAALLLQAKTLLDNADGTLARASGRVTLAGRYLDTEADLVVNAALFATLAAATSQPLLALVSFCAVTLVLSAGFNVTELQREAHGRALEPAPSGGPVERGLEAVYRVLFASQDRVLRSFFRRRLARALADETDPDRVHHGVRAYHGDTALLSYVANTGLSTQLAVLGACLVAGAPVVYLWLALACLVPLPFLQLRRERLARRALRGAA